MGGTGTSKANALAQGCCQITPTWYPEASQQIICSDETTVFLYLIRGQQPGV
jgi:hypothetical protein